VGEEGKQLTTVEAGILLLPLGGGLVDGGGLHL